MRKERWPIEEKPRDTIARTGNYYELQKHWHMLKENPLRKMPCLSCTIISQHETVGYTHAGWWGSGLSAASVAEPAASRNWELGSQKAKSSLPPFEDRSTLEEQGLWEGS